MNNYEVAVYAAECDELALAIKSACLTASEITDQRVRAAIVGAAMATAAQMLDGNRMPEETGLLKPNGIAQKLSDILAGRSTCSK